MKRLQGGAEVYVSSVESAFFYKYMTVAGTENVLESTEKFALYFLVPLYIALLTGWFMLHNRCPQKMST